MRLLHYDDANRITLTKDLTEDEANRRRYAILSHTWGDDEVLLRDLAEQRAANKAGYQKIVFCAKRARRDGLKYFWVDTCCINKKDAVEVTSAINSMFRWYQRAEKCYVYLSDVSATSWESAFRKSRWFTRGWTLQELLAPKCCEFYSREGTMLGDKSSLERQVFEITGIKPRALRSTSFTSLTREERYSWMDGRQTTHEEDLVYALLGLFDVSMPVIYGERMPRARKRLERELDNAYKGNYQDNFSLPQSDELDTIAPSVMRKYRLYESHINQLKELHRLNIREKEQMYAQTVSRLAARESEIETLKGENKALAADIANLKKELKENDRKHSDDKNRMLKACNDELQNRGQEADRKLGSLHREVEAISQAKVREANESEEKHSKLARELKLYYTQIVRTKEEEIEKLKHSRRTGIPEVNGMLQVPTQANGGSSRREVNQYGDAGQRKGHGYSREAPSSRSMVDLTTTKIQPSPAPPQRQHVGDGRFMAQNDIDGASAARVKPGIVVDHEARDAAMKKGRRWPWRGD